MPLPPVNHRLLPLLLMGSAVVLGASSKNNTESRAAEAQKVAAVAIAPAMPPLPKIDCWKPVSTHMAVTYSSQCKRPPNARPRRSSL